MRQSLRERYAEPEPTAEVIKLPITEEVERLVMEKVRRRRKIFMRTLLLYVGFALFISIFLSTIINFAFHDYSDEIVYVEYRMEEGDSLFNVIQTFNKDNPKFEDVRDLMNYAKKENGLSSEQVKAGGVYKIPVLTSE